MDLVSVIVPVYNNSMYLDKCITSIIRQTYKKLEIILINDGSTDDSLHIIKKYAKLDKRIKVIDKQNEGVSIARNTGILASTGKYLVFVDSDDYLDADEIASLYRTIINKKTDLVRSNYKVHYQNNKKIDYGSLEGIANKLFKKEEIKDIIIKKVLDGSLPCFVYLLMIKREVLLKTNLFCADIHMMEDVILYLELLLKCDSIYILDKPMYNIMFNLEGATNNKKNYERNIFNVISVNIYISNILKENNLDNPDNLKRLNTANAIAISDFIFKDYLAENDTISLCTKLSKDSNMKNILTSCNYKVINKQRKIILKCLENNHLNILKIYFVFRKKLRKLKGQK